MRGLGIIVLKILSCESYFSIFNSAFQHKMISTALKATTTQNCCRCRSCSRGAVTNRELQQSFS